MRQCPKLFKDMLYAVGAQAVSLAASVAVSFLAPRFIGAGSYAYWQLFLFYVTYINLSRLGLIDGLYLRLGGRDYAELDHPLLACEWRLFVLFQCGAAALTFAVLCRGGLEPDRRFVAAACCVCMVLINSNNFFSYVLQAVNRTKQYSVSVMLQNLAWFAAVGAILAFRLYTYKVLVVLYVAGHLAAGLYLAAHAKEIWRGPRCPVRATWADIKASVRCGLVLMLSVYAGNLVLGSARMIVDRALDVETFGYLSFALTLANCVLAFISRVSVVLFPALRRVTAQRQAEAYRLASELLGLVLPAVLLGELPARLLVRWWLPQYEPSLPYLAFFLPVCVLDGRMVLLCSTYFKALRREGLLLGVNLAAAAASAALALAGSVWVRNLRFIAASLLAVTAVRSIVSETMVARLLGQRALRPLLREGALVAVYLAASLCLPAYAAFGVYLLVYLVYLWTERGTVRALWGRAAGQGGGEGCES